MEKGKVYVTAEGRVESVITGASRVIVGRDAASGVPLAERVRRIFLGRYGRTEPVAKINAAEGDRKDGGTALEYRALDASQS